MAHAFSPSWQGRPGAATQCTAEKNVVETLQVDQVARKVEKSSCGNNDLQLNILSVPRPLSWRIYTFHLLPGGPKKWEILKWEIIETIFDIQSKYLWRRINPN